MKNKPIIVDSILSTIVLHKSLLASLRVTQDAHIGCLSPPFTVLHYITSMKALSGLFA